MHKRLLSVIAFGITCCSLTVAAEDWPQWRGLRRTGISSETGLLKEWPPQGPRLVWQVTDVGYGFGTPSIAGDRIYLLSNEGLENEFVRAVNVSDGKRIWSTRTGKVGKSRSGTELPGSSIDADCRWRDAYAFSSVRT